MDGEAPGPEARDLTVGYFVRETDGASHVGALLVVTGEGDPVDFVYTEPLVLRALVLALLGERAESHVVLHLLTEPLLAKLQAPPSLLLYEEASLLQRQVSLEMPCAVLAGGDLARRGADWEEAPAPTGDGLRRKVWVPTACGRQAKGLIEAAAAALAPLALEEPFARVRAALQELRRQE